jgi:hypothetical protein
LCLLSPDTDRSICTVTWRGQVAVDGPSQPGRVLIAVEEPGQRLTWANIASLAGAPMGSAGASDPSAGRRSLPKVGVLRLVHGNEGDPWNGVDYADLLAKAESGASFGYPPGSKLVAEVLNPLKTDGFAHIDLLKPEETVALPLTLALWPEQTKTYLKKAFPAFFAASVNDMRARLAAIFNGKSKHFGPPPPAGSTAPPAPEDLLAKALAQSFGASDASALTLATLLAHERGPGAFSRALAAEPAQGKTFAGSPEGGVIDRALRAASNKANVIKRALKEAAKDAAGNALQATAEHMNRWSSLWSLEEPDNLDLWVRRTFDDEADDAVVIVAGHTHLARAVSYPDGYYYLNTGTWANLMRIPTYFRGAEFAAHAWSLKEYLKDPAKGPAELRPFQRLTYVDVDLRPLPGGPAFRAELREWAPGPSRTIGRFP